MYFDEAKLFEERINLYIKNRTPLDITAVYLQLKDKYNLTLTTTYALENGREDYGEDFTVLCGVSSVGSFYLYDDGLYSILDYKLTDGTCPHRHPENISEAVKSIENFMNGIVEV